MGLFNKKVSSDSMGAHKLNLVRDKDDSRDLKLRSYMKIFTLPKSIDLRPCFPSVFSQNDQGSCTANGGISVLEYMIYRKKGRRTVLSRQFLYNKERMNDGTPLDEDSGTSVRQICKTLKKDGACDEALFPYGWKNFDKEPGAAACYDAINNRIKAYFRCETMLEIKYALASELPVLVGCEIYEDFYRTGRDGKVPSINTKSECLGGHLMVLVGYKTNPITGKVTYIMRNSWGESKEELGVSWGYDFNNPDNPSDEGFGDKGYCYIDEKNLKAILMDAWCISEI